MLTEKLLSNQPLGFRGNLLFAALLMAIGAGIFVLVCFGLSLLR